MQASFTHSEFPFLKELGIEETNSGVYHSGQWQGSGPEFVSVNPHNNKPIAKIKMASAEDYEACI